MTVTEMFFSVEVKDMQRATDFYVRALDAAVEFSSPAWSSLRLAGVRLGLALNERHTGNRVGLHFAVGDLAAAFSEVESAGGRGIAASIEVAPGLFIAEVSDTEGNIFTLTRAQPPA